MNLVEKPWPRDISRATSACSKARGCHRPRKPELPNSQSQQTTMTATMSAESLIHFPQPPSSMWWMTDWILVSGAVVWDIGRGIFGLAQFLELPVQGAPGNAELAGGLGYVAFALGKGLQNE